MENLNPCLDLIMEARQALESGESVRLAIRRFSVRPGQFPKQCGRWLILFEKGGDPQLVLREIQSAHRRSLLNLFARGLRGEPIAGALKDFELEVVDACKSDLERHVALLPLKLMPPLLLLIVPSLLILLLGPLLDSLSRGLSGL